MAGIRTPALATAALTSVALLSQTADAAPRTTDDKPSLEDVEQKVGALYREAGEATGTFTVIRDRIPRQPKGSGALREGAVRTPRETRGTQSTERGAQRTGEARGPQGAPAAAPYRPDPGVPGAASALLTDGRPSRATADPAPSTAERPVAGAGGRSNAGAPAAVQNALQSSKARVQTKLTAARALLAQHSAAAQQTGQPTTREATPTPESRQAAEAPRTFQSATPSSPFPETAPLPNPAETFPETVRSFPGTAQTFPGAAQSLGAQALPDPAQPVATPPAQAAQQPTGDTLTDVTAPPVSVRTAAEPPPPAASSAPAPAPVEDTAYTANAAKALSFARAQIGKPYVWGATGPDAFDCAGLAQAAWKAAGVALPRTAYEQSIAGSPVDLTAALPGDLILYCGDASHTALYIGNGMIIHAPKPGGYVRQDPVFYADAPIHSVVRPS